MKENNICVTKDNKLKGKGFNAILFWVLGLSISLFSSISLAISFGATFHRVNMSEMPENPVGFLLGGIIVGGFCLSFHFTMYVALLILTLVAKLRICFSDLLLKKDMIVKNIVRIIGYFIVFLFIKSYFTELIRYKEFVIWEFSYYLSSILTTIIYIIWVNSFFKEKKL